MKKGDKVKITATKKELKLCNVNDLSIDAIMDNNEATVHIAGSKVSDVSTALGLWILPNEYLEKI